MIQHVGFPVHLKKFESVKFERWVNLWQPRLILAFNNDEAQRARILPSKKNFVEVFLEMNCFTGKRFIRYCVRRT